MSRIKFGQSTSVVTMHSAVTTFTKPSATTDGGSNVVNQVRAYAPPDMLLTIKGDLAWAFDKIAGIFGMRADGTWDRIETPLANGTLISGLAGVGQSYALATGAYQRYALGAWDGTTLTSTTAVTVTATPIFSVEG